MYVDPLTPDRVRTGANLVPSESVIDETFLLFLYDSSRNTVGVRFKIIIQLVLKTFTSSLAPGKYYYLWLVLRWAGALTFWYGCTVYVGVDVWAGDAEVDAIYIHSS